MRSILRFVSDHDVEGEQPHKKPSDPPSQVDQDTLRWVESSGRSLVPRQRTPDTYTEPRQEPDGHEYARGMHARPGQEPDHEDSNKPFRGPVFDPAFAKVAALLLALMFLAKVYGAARFSLTTATALATAGSPVSVLLGTLTLYEYAFIGLVAAASAWAFAAGLRRTGELRWWRPLTFPLAVFTCFLTPLYYLKWAFISVAAALICFGALKSPPAITLFSRVYQLFGALESSLNKLFKRAHQQQPPPEVVGHTPDGRSVTQSLEYADDEGSQPSTQGCPDQWVPPNASRVAVYVAIMAIMLFIFVTIQRPWLPAEVVTLSKPITVNPVTRETATRPVVYVIADGSGWTTLLIDSDRYLAMVPTVDVQKQRICHLNDQLGNGQTLFDFIMGRPYTSPNLSCSRLTDQPEEKTN